jgi:hypothetical protein
MTAFNGEEDDGDEDRADGLEELMPELVAMVQPRRQCWPRRVSLRVHRLDDHAALQHQPATRGHYQHEEQEQDKEDYSKQFPGTSGRVRMQPWEAISRCSSGHSVMAVPGTS